MTSCLRLTGSLSFVFISLGPRRFQYYLLGFVLASFVLSNLLACSRAFLFRSPCF
jgi:hypothetical protein